MDFTRSPLAESLVALAACYDVYFYKTLGLTPKGYSEHPHHFPGDVGSPTLGLADKIKHSNIL